MVYVWVVKWVGKLIGVYVKNEGCLSGLVCCYYLFVLYWVDCWNFGCFKSWWCICVNWFGVFRGLDIIYVEGFRG